MPRKGLEPSRLAAHGPEPCASTNSAIWATGVFLGAGQDDVNGLSQHCPQSPLSGPGAVPVQHGGTVDRGGVLERVDVDHDHRPPLPVLATRE